MVHMVLKEWLRLSNGLANRSFCLSDTLRVQLVFNLTGGDSL